MDSKAAECHDTVIYEIVHHVHISHCSHLGLLLARQKLSRSNSASRSNCNPSVSYGRGIQAQNRRSYQRASRARAGSRALHRDDAVRGSIRDRSSETHGSRPTGTQLERSPRSTPRHICMGPSNVASVRKFDIHRSYWQRGSNGVFLGESESKAAFGSGGT